LGVYKAATIKTQAVDTPPPLSSEGHSITATYLVD
jgi:hypothetical protein